MGYFRAADIPGLLADFGVDITLGLVTVKGILDDGEECVLDGEAGAGFQQGQPSVIVQTGALAGLDVGSSLTVDGVAGRIVRECRKVGDGALTRVYVR